MNFLILGDGPDERAWARAIADSERHRLAAAYPGLEEYPEVSRCRDLDDALATANIDAAVIGGPFDGREETLRRVAAQGLKAICMHPPGPDSEAYYQVAMSRAETGAVIVPDLAERLHPGVSELRRALESQALGKFRSLRFESTADTSEGDLAQLAFSRAGDLIRALLGEIEAVNASGDPQGEHPVFELVVQLRAVGSRRAEIRIRSGPEAPSRLTLEGTEGSLTLELPADLDGPARLTRRGADGDPEVETLDPWDSKAALLAVLDAASAGRAVHPDLADATRAMEVTEGVVRSLRRGRTVELHYEEISEAGTFKSVMTSVGCMALLSILVIVPLALAGPALGIGGTIYLAYVIPPLLIVFVLLQFLRFAVRREPEETAPPES